MPQCYAQFGSMRLVECLPTHRFQETTQWLATLHSSAQAIPGHINQRPAIRAIFLMPCIVTLYCLSRPSSPQKSAAAHTTS